MTREEQLKAYLASFSRLSGGASYGELSQLPTMEEVRSLIGNLMDLLHPGRGIRRPWGGLEDTLRTEMDLFAARLSSLILLAWRHAEPEEELGVLRQRSSEAVDALLDNLASIRRSLKTDAQAGFEGDPAAQSLAEVITCYPAFQAISVHRVAHLLHQQHVPMLPRMMSEVVHGATGIDIHPGATIGDSFFIDHGSGVVIGETTVIGEHVKLYQGVTLGALSFPRDACGQLLKGVKRHPTIEDDVTIYANATVLGDVTVGRGSTIGSSVWIKEDVPPGTLVMNKDPEVLMKSRPIRKG